MRIRPKQEIPQYKLADDTKLDTPFAIKRMEEIDASLKNKTEEAHRHDYYVIIWVEKGSGTHFIDFSEYELSDGMLFFIAPAQIHLLQPDTSPVGSVLLFKPEFLHLIGLSEAHLVESGLFHDFDHHPVKVSSSFEQKMQTIIQQLLTYSKIASSSNLELLAAYLKVFLLECIQLKNNQENNTTTQNTRYQDIICDFRKLLGDHYQEKHKVSDYAEALHLSPNYFNEVIKKNTGKTAKEHIQKRLIMEAQRNALHTDCTLQEITFHLGFKDPAHFSKFFKKHSGLSFQEYRKQIRKIYQ